MSNQSKNLRLISLDALRGFDMFWIMSGEHIIHALAETTHIPAFEWMSEQLHHTAWNGITFYDMIFPLFLFIAGASMPFSMQKKLQHFAVEEPFQLPSESKNALYWSMIQRTFKLILLGMIVNGLLKWNGYEQTRIASVLGRIGLAWLFAGFIYLNGNTKTQVFWFCFILLFYWVVMKLVPVPGFGAGVLTKDGSLASYVDRLFLPGRLHSKVFDPEGLLSTIPAIGTALLGVFTTTFLKSSYFEQRYAKIGIITLAGLALLLIGLVWDFSFPINKRLWTSSFVCVVGGFSMLFFVIFYLIIDIWGFQKWASPFIWIGSNSILIYMASEGMVNFGYTANFLFGGIISHLPEHWHHVLTACSVTFLQIILLKILYKNKVFLKV
ncbi:MAG: acyltransferase family protein [Flectobacillus sp.]|uniref:acyltransferase family protein n=1 Tax=Flectobacillus sp. TaxID=50419 RepID=UPI003B9B3EE2